MDVIYIYTMTLAFKWQIHRYFWEIPWHYTIQVIRIWSSGLMTKSHEILKSCLFLKSYHTRSNCTPYNIYTKKRASMSCSTLSVLNSPRGFSSVSGVGQALSISDSFILLFPTEPCISPVSESSSVSIYILYGIIWGLSSNTLLLSHVHMSVNTVVLLLLNILEAECTRSVIFTGALFHCYLFCSIRPTFGI